MHIMFSVLEMDCMPFRIHVFHDMYSFSKRRHLFGLHLYVFLCALLLFTCAFSALISRLALVFFLHRACTSSVRAGHIR